ncbi:MAG: MBL fold metallo-hydrolase RNA specificity domain-containing protein, partial [Eubacteriales bacterium]|nr:MBL fold metallo-hydrolase RNA specificity domain-containing protein [Eubacteriales bacterium]
KAKILSLPGISGHADREHLTDWVKGMMKLPERIFVVHGEGTVTDGFAAHLQECTGCDTIAPYSGDAYDLITGEMIARGSREMAKKEQKSGSSGKSGKVSSVYDRLLAAGERLIAVIHQNKGGANKDLAKFADQITALCEKWTR